jgi:exonuclease SbcC
MKLHSIQVTNLNSLFGTQSVDLDTDLGGASLFLIAGPTGAGKSTLMDAVSLALFGTTPRLEESSKGHKRAPRDVAEQIMTRGTGEAQAVVEFSRLDTTTGKRQRYRATWKARRAYGRPDGAIQAVTRGVEWLGPDGAVTRAVSDHREKVFGPHFDEALAGFTPQDFQRSMLLAQGRFDAMLRAKPEERATILERLTATEDLFAIGAAAAKLATAWRARIDELRARAEALSAATPQQLKELSQAVQQHRGALARTKAQLEAARAQQAWLLGLATLSEALQRAQAQQAEAQAAQHAAAPQQARLSEHERCGPALGLLDGVEQAQGRLARTITALAELEGQLPALQQQRDRARISEVQAVAQAEQAAAALESLREPVRLALGTAQQLRTAQEEQRRAEAREATARGVLQQRRDEHEGASAQASNSVARLQRARQQRLEQEPSAPLAQALPELERTDAVLREASQALQTERAALTAAQVHAAEQERALETRRQAFEAGRATRLEPLDLALQRAGASLAEQVGQADPELHLQQLRERREASLTRAAGLDTAAGAVQRSQGARDLLAQRQARLDQAEQALEQAQTELAPARARVEQASQGVQQAQALVEPWELVVALADERQALRPGAQCPLCGSTEHPYLSDPAQRDKAAAAQASLDEARAELARQRAALDQAQQQQAQQREALARREAAAATQRAEQRAAATELERLEAEAAEAVAALGIEPSTDHAALLQAASQARVQADRARDEAGAVQRAAEAVQQAGAALQAEQRVIDGEAAALERQATHLAAATEQRQAQAQALERRGTELAERERSLLARLAELGIHVEPLADALEQARGRVRAFEQAVAALEQAEQAQVTAESERSAAERALNSAEEILAEHLEALARRRAQHEGAQADHTQASVDLRERWSVVTAQLQGQVLVAPDAQPEALLQAWSEHARSLSSRADQARQQREAHARALSDAQARGQTLAQQRDEQAREQGELTERLAQALQALGLPDSAALAERRIEPATVQALRQQRQSLLEHGSRASAALEAAQQQLEQHEGHRPAELEEQAQAPELADRVAELEGEHEALTQAHTQASAELLEAQRGVERAARAREDLQRVEQQARPWLTLHDLIGVNGGKRFQLFAQALNLDLLLARANRHLQILRDRYRLRTVPDPDSGLPTLDFEVEDRDLQGTTRSLDTLSGGESFLVSLALALGLSDLRTSSLPIETLMLDEGFGALDPTSLETALAALGQLQASGRQVGIISHVQGLHERIVARIVVEPTGEGHSRIHVP